jgi:hypothetical protein
MCSSEPEFSVVDYIWEEVHSISGSPQKSCGYAPYLMHVIETITNYTFVYDHEHKPFHLKNDVMGPSLADLEGTGKYWRPRSPRTAYCSCYTI